MTAIVGLGHLALLERDDAAVRLAFRVRDTGIGTDPQPLPRLFGAITQVDAASSRRYGISGLGHSICKQLTELMGATISAECRTGAGSCCRFEPPLDIDRSSPTMAPARHSDLRGTRALVVDETPEARQVLGDMLESFQFQVVRSDSAHGAWEILPAADRDGSSPCDLVLMDIRMPDIDGYQTTAAIRARPELIGLPVIGMTADVMAGERCLAAGINEHIPKPMDPARLRSGLELGDPRVDALLPRLRVQLAETAQAETLEALASRIDDYVFDAALAILHRIGDHPAAARTEVVAHEDA